MGVDSEKIRHEIIKILETAGKTRSKKLAEMVFIEKGVGSEKTVYREIKAMKENGDIRKTGSGHHISYDIPNVTEKHRLTVLNLLEYAENNFEHLEYTHKKIVNKKNLVPMEILSDIVWGIQQLQKIETRTKIYKLHPGYKKTKEWGELKKQIEKNWKGITSLIIDDSKRPEESGLITQILMNFRPTMRGFMTSVDPVSDSKHAI